jgi:hypothetical protein
MRTSERTVLTHALASHGLRLRGGWIPTAADALPSLPGGHAAAVVWMVGVVGSDFWPHFQASAFYQDGLPDPLDRWNAHIGNAMAAEQGGRALFPFEGPPYYPFQQWADRSEPTTPSPMMLRMHPQYGLWHAYRFALALPVLHAHDAAGLQAARPAQASDVCARCSGQPCLQACPVGAYTGTGFALDACSAHLHANTTGSCMQQGCLARRACPEGNAHRYTSEHAAFHMQAFIQRH